VAAALHPIPGVRMGVVQAGIRKAGRKDLTLLLIDPEASVGGVFTQNRFCAAPVQVCREHLASGHGVRAIVINTGKGRGTGAFDYDVGRKEVRLKDIVSTLVPVDVMMWIDPRIRLGQLR